MIPGLDVSNYQTVIHWPSVAASGREFAFAKASEGVAYADPWFANNWAGMANVGMVRGAYHYARPDSNAPADEAAYFLSVVGELQPGDLLALDIEIGENNLQAWALAWLQAVEAAVGFKPFLYSSLGFMTAHGLTGNADLAQYGLWIAAWNVSSPIVPPPWEFWALWQTGDTGSIPGVNGAVDTDQFNGTRDQLLAYGKPAPIKKPFDDAARLQLVGYVAGGSGVADLTAWLGGYA